MKKGTQFLFETQLAWQDGTKGIITSREVADPLNVSTPKVFKGTQEGNWSPEDLLISALSSCFMTTYLFYAKWKGLSISHFDCQVIGHVELINGRLAFTQIDIYPKIAVERTEWLDMAKEIIEMTKKDCLIAKALNVNIYYHPVVELIQQPIKKNEAILLN